MSYDIYKKLGIEIGELVASKQVQYGDSANRAGRILAVLYPNGVPLHAYDDALLIVRCLDKFSRIAQRGENGKDLGGESPWKDIAGYGLLGWEKDDCVEDEELPSELANVSPVKRCFYGIHPPECPGDTDKCKEDWYENRPDYREESREESRFVTRAKEIARQRKP